MIPHNLCEPDHVVQNDGSRIPRNLQVEEQV